MSLQIPLNGLFIFSPPNSAEPKSGNQAPAEKKDAQASAKAAMERCKVEERTNLENRVTMLKEAIKTHLAAENFSEVRQLETALRKTQKELETLERSCQPASAAEEKNAAPAKKPKPKTEAKAPSATRGDAAQTPPNFQIKSEIVDNKGEIIEMRLDTFINVLPKDDLSRLRNHKNLRRNFESIRRIETRLWQAPTPSEGQEKAAPKK